MAKKNLTLQLDEALLKRARHITVESDQSLSEWVSQLIEAEVRKKNGAAQSKKRALDVLRAPLKLDCRALTREEIHER